MIVRNESKIIARCFQAARNIIDAAVICDTGSTDDTVTVIRQLLQFVPGALAQHEWKNFGHNRTLSAKAAVHFVERIGWPLDKTYMLFLDADMILNTLPDFRKSALCEIGYLLHQTTTGTTYANVRLARCDAQWQSMGVTHEYWVSAMETPKNRNQETIPLLSSLSIDDRNDGGCKADKFERDAALLEKGLQEEPQNERYLFYLGQTYRDLSAIKLQSHPTESADFARRSIETYERRIEKGGWPEELYHAKLSIAVCFELLKDYDTAIARYMAAWEFRPTRAEALAKAATMCRSLRRHALAALFAKQALSLPISKDLLFVEQLSHTLQPLFDLSVSGFYTETEKDLGFHSAERILSDRALPQSNLIPRVQSNQYYYAQPLLSLSGIEVFQLQKPESLSSDGTAARMFPMNPSIIPHPDRPDLFLLNLRLVNYRIQKPLQYTFPFQEDGTRVFTKNALMSFRFGAAASVELTDAMIIDETSAVQWSSVQSMIEGHEDIRLFVLRGRLWCTFTCCQPTGAPQLCLGRYNPLRTAIDHAVLLRGSMVQRIEKNWLPIVDNDELRILYSSDPTIVLSVDTETGDCTTLIEKPCPIRFSFARGSAPPIPWRPLSENHWLATHPAYARKRLMLYVTHEVVYKEQFRIYYHRFVVMTLDDFEIIARSRPFVFFEKQIEFASGLAQCGDRLLITFGVWDATAHLMSIPSTRVEKMLRPLTSF